MTVDSTVHPTEFRTLLSRFASGVTVVSTIDAAGRPHGMTVSAFSSLSAEPPLVLVCIDAQATMCTLLGTAPSFSVNILDEAQQELSRRFADTAMELRFDGVPWQPGAGGVPLLAGAHATIECRRTATFPGGDHIILVGEVVGGHVGEATQPLLYHRGGYGRLGR